MTDIYFDNSATTPPFQAVIDLMSKIQADFYGNPSSLHGKGLASEKIIKEARIKIASFFRGDAREIFFTSGGTEANNLAIKGVALRRRSQGIHLLTSQIEHPSVLNCFHFLESEGFKVDFLPVNKQGLIKPEDLQAALQRNTALVSIMHINNETGSIQPLAKLGQMIKKNNPDTLFHIDAVQSFARIPLETEDWQADLISCCAHKIHGPKGIGTLWIREGTNLQPLLHGGGQEKDLRPGTENTAAIAGFGYAAELLAEKQRKLKGSLDKNKNLFYRKLLENGITCRLNGPALDQGAPHIINISFPGLKAEVLLHALEERGVYVSSGSACHSRHSDSSHVLQALGLSERDIDSALRFSFSVLNSRKDFIEAAAILSGAVKELEPLMKA